MTNDFKLFHTRFGLKPEEVEPPRDPVDGLVIRFQETVVADLIRITGSFSGKEIMVSGKVVAGTAAGSSRGLTFLLDDGTGSVLVVTKEDVPGGNQ